MNITAAIVLLLAMMAVRPYESHAQVQAPPSDFAFRFEFGVCTTDVMDTFQNIFTSDEKSDQHPSISVPLVLPAASVRAIYEALVASRFFEYPSDFHVDSSSLIVPSYHYRLEVRSGGARHTVSWRDDAGNASPQADRLRALFKRIEGVIYERPEFRQRFFGMVVACA